MAKLEIGCQVVSGIKDNAVSTTSNHYSCVHIVSIHAT